MIRVSPSDMCKMKGGALRRSPEQEWSKAYVCVGVRGGPTSKVPTEALGVTGRRTTQWLSTQDEEPKSQPHRQLHVFRSLVLLPMKGEKIVKPPVRGDEAGAWSSLDS